MHMLSELHELLTATTAVKREKLAAVISSTAGASPADICDHFLHLRFGVSEQAGVRTSYKQIVTDVADAISLDWAAVDGHENWVELRSETIEEQIARRLYAGAKQLPDARAVPLRSVRVHIRWSLADLLSRIAPAAGAADRYVEKLTGGSFTLSVEWNSLLAGVLFVHTEVR